MIIKISNESSIFKHKKKIKFLGMISKYMRKFEKKKLFFCCCQLYTLIFFHVNMNKANRMHFDIAVI